MRIFISSLSSLESRTKQQERLISKLEASLKSLRYIKVHSPQDQYSATRDLRLFESFDSRISVKLTFENANPLFKYFLEVKTDGRRIIYSEVDRSYIEDLPRILTKIRNELQ